MNIPANRKIVDLPIVKLPDGPHRGKDQYKSDFSNKLIARGSAGSSTEKYASLSQLAGIPVNCGEYSSQDVVFISANGNRPGAIQPDLDEINKAITAGATILTDAKSFRPEGGHLYNSGEQVLANTLRKAGFIERVELNGKVCRWHKEGTEPAFILKQEVIDNLTQKKEKTWARNSENGYEVSSRGGNYVNGDKQFSALYARLKDGRSIEEAYQLDVKGYRAHGTDWKIGKGKEPLHKMTKQEQFGKYKALWSQWCDENPGKLEMLERRSKGKVLTDAFATSEINQARVLAELINERIYKIVKKEEPSLFNSQGSNQENKTGASKDINSISLPTLPPKANFCVIKVSDPFLPESIREKAAIYKAIPNEELNRYNAKANPGAQRIPIIKGTEFECKVFATSNDDKVRAMVKERIDVRINLFTPLNGTTQEELSKLKVRYQQLTEDMKLSMSVSDVDGIAHSSGKQITF